MATITSADFDAANAGFNALSSDTTRIYYDGDMTISAEGEPTAPANTRTDFGGAFSDDLPFTLVVPRLAIGTTELNTLRNGTIITTDGAPNFGTAADYTFTVACNVDWENINFMCSNGGTNGWGLAGSGVTVRPVGRVVGCTFGTTAMTAGGTPGLMDTFSLTRDNNFSSAIPGAGEWAVSTVFEGNSREPSRDPADWVGGGINIDTSNVFTNIGNANIGDITTVTIAGSAGDVVLTVQNGLISGSDYDFEITAATGNALTTGEYPGAGTAGSSLDITFATAGTAGVAGPEGLWFVNLANVDASFVFANNAFDAAVLNTAAAGNYVIGLSFAGTTRAQGSNNLYTMRINNFTSVGPWTVVMNNSFANNAAAPYAVGAGAAGIVHYQSNGYPGAGLSVLLINERYEGNALFLSRRGGGEGTYISTYAWNPTFITPASATIADAKLLGVGSNNIYQVPTGTTDRAMTFDAQYPSISDGTIVSSSNGYLVQVGANIVTGANDVVSTAPAVRDFVSGDLIATPVVLRAKSYTHLIDTTVTSEIDAIENSGGNNGSFSFTESSATTADVDTSLIAGTFAETRALNGSAVAHNEGAALYSRLKADWYGEDGLNEPLTSFAGTSTAGTISSIHNIDLSDAVGSASVDATSGIVLPASAGVTGDSVYSAISTTGNITLRVPSTNMSLTGTILSLGAVAISGGTLAGTLNMTAGVTFDGVEFDGTINLVSDAQLDLSTCTFGSNFAVSSSTARTVLLSADTSSAVQTIFTDAGWTVTFPATTGTLAIQPQRNGRYGVKRMYQGTLDNQWVAPTDMVAGTSYDIALTSDDNWSDGDYIEVWYKYDSDVANSSATSSLIYQESVYRHDFTGASPGNITSGSVAFSVPITTVIVGTILPSEATISTDSNTVVTGANTTSAVVQFGVQGASTTRTVNQSQGFAAEISNRDDYFDVWFDRSASATLLDYGLTASGSAAMNWNTDAITFASAETTTSTLDVGGTPTQVTVPAAQGVTNWSIISGSTGAFTLKRAGSDEVAVTLAGGASLAQVVSAAEIGVNQSSRLNEVDVNVSDIETIVNEIVVDTREIQTDVDSMRTNRLLGLKPQSAKPEA